MDLQQEIDKDNMLGVIKSSPDQLTAGLELAKDVKLDKKFDSIVLSGMGGSALVGELLEIYLDEQSKIENRKSKVRIHVNRSYSLLPESYDPSCLNIISSYSGNTEEVLSCLDEALKNNLTILGIGSGGKLKKICEEKNFPFIKMPVPSPSFQPRCATGYGFSALLMLMAQNGLIMLNAERFKTSAKKLKSSLSEFEKLGKEIAEKLQGKTPIIYAPVHFGSLAMIWKIMFNENSKTPAFWNYFPELSHNEMVGFTKLQGKFHFIMLRDKNDHPNNLKRLNITADLFREYSLESAIVDVPEGDIIYRIFAALQIGSFASYNLALAYGIDPTPVVMVEKLKKMLAG